MDIKYIGRISKGMAGQVYSPQGINRTLTAGEGGRGSHTGLILTTDNRIRKLTPTECERLQAFSDNWSIGISNSQRYKCLGNAVTTSVVAAILDRMY
jgi:DNA (cytosine-5)-methyltransferase 3A